MNATSTDRTSARARLPRWIVGWFALSIPIVLWDVAFVLMRPRSLPDGDLGALWRVPYAQYIAVDHSYGDIHNPFVWTQAWMSIGEAIIGIAAIVLSSRGRLPLALLLAFCSASLTCAKTILILLMELVGNGPNVGHNGVIDLVTLYVVPNAFWIVVPFAVAWTTGRTLVHAASREAPPS